MSKKEIDEVSGTETTGHEWDGIKELNKPLPRWWLWTFYATIVWAIGYMVFYPAIPLVTGATKGVLGYSSRADVAREIADAKTGMAGLLDKVDSMSLEDIRKDPDLFQFAVAGGRSAFAVNCVQCHGSGASGGKGYPNLNDDEWLWGGSLEAIHTTLVHGIRFEGDDDTRVSDMPAFGRDGVLDTAQINDVAEHVLALSGQEHDQAAAERGTAIFEDNCAACHGAQGEGIADVGAPALDNAIWLYGGDKASIVETVTNARRGVMPAWGGRLDDATLKQLAVYVHSLGGGQ
jgi:cytochrome c oxidase cbb3-type subunit III